MPANRSIVIKSRVRAYLAGVLCLVFRVLAPWRESKNKGKTRVLVFHHIDDGKLFDGILRRLSKRYHILSFEDYVQGLKSTSRMNVIIALDDGYRSWYEIARPLFQAYHIKPLLFVSSDFIGKEERVRRIIANPVLKRGRKPL